METYTVLGNFHEVKQVSTLNNN